jgi:hypothetical protein
MAFVVLVTICLSSWDLICLAHLSKTAATGMPISIGLFCSLVGLFLGLFLTLVHMPRTLSKTATLAFSQHCVPSSPPPPQPPLSAHLEPPGLQGLSNSTRKRIDEFNAGTNSTQVGVVRRAAGGGVGVGGLVVVGGQAGGEMDVVSSDSGIALAKFRVQEAVRDRVNGGGGGGGGGKRRSRKVSWNKMPYR